MLVLTLPGSCLQRTGALNPGGPDGTICPQMAEIDQVQGLLKLGEPQLLTLLALGSRDYATTSRVDFSSLALGERLFEQLTHSSRRLCAPVTAVPGNNGS